MGFFHHWLRGSQDNRTKQQTDDVLNGTIASSLSVNLQHLSVLFNGIPELVIRTFRLKTGHETALVYMDGLADKTAINTDILRPLLFQEWNENDFWESSVSVGQIKKVDKWPEIEQALLNGKSILLLDGQTVEENWPAAFAKAAVTVSPALKILDHGIIE